MTTFCTAVPARRPAHERGFTLIEALIALMVFSIGVLALAAVVPYGTNRVGKATGQTRSGELATERAEILLSTPYDDGDLTAGWHNDTANPYQVLYHVRWNVEDNQPITSCKRVTVVVNRPTLTSPTVAKVVIVVPEAGS
ncbi:MAG: type IV pilus modification PilV family protein [bacterium]